MNNIDELQEFLEENLDFEVNRYFYHITSKGRAFGIIEAGLQLAEPKLETTTIEITEDMLLGLAKYISNEYVPHSVMRREELVLLGIPHENINYAIEESFDEIPYVILNQYVMGYIDLSTLNYFPNVDCEYCGIMNYKNSL